MPRQAETVDPYATPPLKHDKGGALVRIGVIAVILAAGAWGFAAFNSGQQSASLSQTQTAGIAQPQQMADASDVQNLPPAPIPEATPAPAERAAPAPRATAHRPAARESTPAPTTNFESTPVAPTAPVVAPIPPDSATPPATTTP